jgi:hypothetical protein
MTTTPPHQYKTQRRLEKESAHNRDEMLANGESMPPVCGFTYTPRKPKNPPEGWVGAPTHCTRVAGAGTQHHGKGFCDYHEWVIETEKPKTAQFGAALAFAAEKSRFFGQPKATDPHSALMDEIARTAGIVGWLEDKLQRLKDDGTPEDEVLTQWSKQLGDAPSVWMQLFQQERDHLVKVCIAAIKAGVAERKVQIAEQQGRLIAAMMFAFMHDPELGLSPDQMLAAPKLIRKHLMQLPQSNPQAVDPQALLESTTQKVRPGMVIDV